MTFKDACLSQKGGRKINLDLIKLSHFGTRGVLLKKITTHPPQTHPPKKPTQNQCQYDLVMNHLAFTTKTQSL